MGKFEWLRALPALSVALIFVVPYLIVAYVYRSLGWERPHPYEAIGWFVIVSTPIVGVLAALFS